MFLIIAQAPINEKDKKLVEHFFVKYHRLMLYVANRTLNGHALAEDAVSESLVKIIRHREKLRDVSSQQTKAYIVNIVRTTSLDIIKQKGGRIFETDELLEYMPDESVNVEDMIVSQDGCNSVIDAFRKLPEMLKDVAYHYFVFERSHNEIAEILNISVSASQKRLSRARVIIKKLLAGDGNGK